MVLITEKGLIKLTAYNFRSIKMLVITYFMKVITSYSKINLYVVSFCSVVYIGFSLQNTNFYKKKEHYIYFFYFDIEITYLKQLVSIVI